MKKNKIILSLLAITMTSLCLSAVTGINALYFGAGIFAIGLTYGFAKNLFGTTLSTGVLNTGITLTDTTYAGEAAATLIVRAMTNNVMAQGGHMYIKDGIKKSFTIPRWDITFEDFVQDVKATPTPGIEVETVDAKVLTTSEYMIYHEFNPRDFEDHWFAQQIGGNTLLDSTLPFTVESVLTQEVLKRNGAFVNKLVWNGSKALTTKMKYIDGFKTKATASSDTVKTGVSTAFTNVNIATQLQLGYALIPTALKYQSYANNDGTVNSKLKIFVSPLTFDLYCQYQIAQANKGVDVTKVGVGTYRGITLVPIPDFPNDYYMIAVGQPDMSSNLWMGMNSSADESTIQIAKKQANSEIWFIKGLAKIDVQIGWNAETVTYE